MLSHEDDHNPDDDERAQRLVDAMAKGSQETIHAAFGKSARFWSVGPLQRLLAVIRGKWPRKP